VSVTTGNGLSGVGSADDPVVMAAAGSSAAGAVTTGTQTIAGAKTFSGSIYLSTAGSGASAPLWLPVSGSINFSGGHASGVQLFSTGLTTLSLCENGSCMYDFGAAALTAPAVTSGGSYTSTAASGDGFVNASGAYIRNAKTFAGAPTAGDCDAAGETGRTAIDTTNHRFYWCEGTAGWKYAAGT
jgi:hypothetical protein